MTAHRTSAPHRTSTPRPPWPGPDWSGAPDNSFRPNAEFGDAELEAALEEANLPILLGSLALLTGDDRWIREPFLPTPPPDLGDHDGGGFGPELATRIRQEAHTVLCAWRDGDLTMADPPAPERLSQILSVILAEQSPTTTAGCSARRWGSTDATPNRRHRRRTVSGSPSSVPASPDSRWRSAWSRRESTTS